MVRAPFAASGLPIDGLGIHEEFVKGFNQSAIGTGFDVPFLVLKILRGGFSALRKFELGALPADRGHPIVTSSFREERTRSGKLTPATGTDAGKLFRTKKFFLDGFYHAIDFLGLRLRKSIEIHALGNSRFDYYIILNPSGYHFNHGSMIRIDFLLKLKYPLIG